MPIVFALAGDELHCAVDQKPKRTRTLARLRNIAANPAVSVLADHYEEDWSRLWWVRADGYARIAEGAAARASIALLEARYEQYASDPPAGPAIIIAVGRWSAWRAS